MLAASTVSSVIIRFPQTRFTEIFRLTDRTSSSQRKLRSTQAVFFGKELAQIFYRNQDAGIFLQILAFLCPFLYLTATLTGILNGLGHTAQCLIQNLAGLGIRILFVTFAIPHMGIRGYLSGLLLSQLIITGLNLIFLHKSVKFRFPAVEWIVLPCCGMILGCGCGLFLYHILSEMKMSGYIALFGSVLITGGIFLLMMKLFNQKTPR